MIDNNENTLLEDYKELIVNYENSRQSYEGIIQEYNNTTAISGIQCNRVVCYLTTPNIINWELVDLYERVLYRSGDYVKLQTCVIELSDISMMPGINFRIRFYKALPGESTYEVFTYVPDSNRTVYVEREYDYNKATYHMKYYGSSPIYYEPNAEPYLYCTGISVMNESSATTKYALYTLDGKLLYDRGLFGQGSIWETSFQDIGIVPGQLFIVKGLLYGGNDCTADAVIKYVPDSLFRATFRLDGGLSASVLVFTGVKKYNPGELLIAKCSNLVAYNLAGALLNWRLQRLDGLDLYTSPNQLQYDTWKADLSNLSVEPGTQIRLKAIVEAMQDRYGGIAIEYQPESSTIYYEYIQAEGNRRLRSFGVVPSAEEPPVIKCSSVSAKHDEYPVIMRWQLLDINNKLIYESSRCSKGEKWNYALSRLNVLPGTKLKLKASVVGGEDSIAYMILEYDPTTEDIVTFGFYGNAFKTVVPYRG